jgi:hypothetical protein
MAAFANRPIPAIKGSSDASETLGCVEPVRCLRNEGYSLFDGGEGYPLFDGGEGYSLCDGGEPRRTREFLAPCTALCNRYKPNRLSAFTNRTQLLAQIAGSDAVGWLDEPENSDLFANTAGALLLPALVILQSRVGHAWSKHCPPFEGGLASKPKRPDRASVAHTDAT